MQRAAPAPDLDVVHPLLLTPRVDLWSQARESHERIDEQANRDAVLGGELSRQAPRDADVAVVIDGDTEYVPMPGNGSTCHEKRPPRIDEGTLSRAGALG